AGAEDAHDMAAGKKADVAVAGPQASNDPIGPGADCLWRFAPRTTIAENLPAGPLHADLGGGEAFVVAVIPFHQVRNDLGQFAEAGQFAGPARPFKRAG